MSQALPADAFRPPAPPPLADHRVYLPNSEGWSVAIKQGWDNDYCFTAFPGEDFFHLLLQGEIYVRHGNEKYCLTCALRHGFLTTDRLYWQRHDCPPAPSGERPDGQSGR